MLGINDADGVDRTTGARGSVLGVSHDPAIFLGAVRVMGPHRPWCSRRRDRRRQTCKRESTSGHDLACRARPAGPSTITILQRSGSDDLVTVRHVGADDVDPTVRRGRRSLWAGYHRRHALPSPTGVPHHGHSNTKRTAIWYSHIDPLVSVSGRYLGDCYGTVTAPCSPRLEGAHLDRDAAGHRRLPGPLQQ
jgi:hypothetical protein